MGTRFPHDLKALPTPLATGARRDGHQTPVTTPIKVEIRFLGSRLALLTKYSPVVAGWNAAQRKLFFVIQDTIYVPAVEPFSRSRQLASVRALPWTLTAGEFANEWLLVLGWRRSRRPKMAAKMVIAICVADSLPILWLDEAVDVPGCAPGQMTWHEFREV